MLKCTGSKCRPINCILSQSSLSQFPCEARGTGTACTSSHRYSQTFSPGVLLQVDSSVHLLNIWAMTVLHKSDCNSSQYSLLNMCLRVCALLSSLELYGCLLYWKWQYKPEIESFSWNWRFSCGSLQLTSSSVFQFFMLIKLEYNSTLSAGYFLSSEP